MINNDVLRRLRYALNLNDSAMVDVFAQGRRKVLPEMLEPLLKKEEQDGFAPLPDDLLNAFLDGLITTRRGKREGAPPPEAPALLTNNVILRKLKIALELRDDDVVSILQLADFRISRGELSAFFRQRDHKNYRECGDQVVRNFLQGLATKLRRPGV